jgi:hypothetical protein
VIRYDRSYFVTARHLPDGLRVRLAATIESVGADHPALPGVGDVAVPVPPAGAVWHRRRLPGSGWWVHYAWNESNVMIRSVTVPST